MHVEYLLSFFLIAAGSSNAAIMKHTSFQDTPYPAGSPGSLNYPQSSLNATTYKNATRPGGNGFKTSRITRTSATNDATRTIRLRQADTKMESESRRGSSGLSTTLTTPTKIRGRGLDLRPTPAPTGESTALTTVFINSQTDFALLLPTRQGELVSDAESDGQAYCTPGSGEGTCGQAFQEGFITAASMTEADDGSWIQITGCMDASRSTMDPADHGGQLDVRFPNGAQCSYGGYAASFIELVEPAANRWCLRCCAAENDQVNCNSHQDREGCMTVIPGMYDFPELGVSCSN